MKKNILLFISLVASLYSFDMNTKVSKDDTLSLKMQTQNKEIVTMVVKEISKNLPQTIDKYTKFVNIKGKNTTLYYFFEINSGSKSDESIIKQDKSRMQTYVTKGICKSSNRFLDAHINIVYVYSSAKTKRELFRFKVSQKDCIGI